MASPNPNQNKGAGKSGLNQTSTGKTTTPTKRNLGENSLTPPAKHGNYGGRSSPNQSPTTARTRWSTSFRSDSHSPNQPSVMNLPQIKRLPTTPFANAMSFVAKVIRLEPRRAMFDSRVQLHCQKVVFADTYTFLSLYMHSDKHEDPEDPKLMEGYTYSVTNFRVIKRGEILIHEATLTEM